MRHLNRNETVSGVLNLLERVSSPSYPLRSVRKDAPPYCVLNGRLCTKPLCGDMDYIKIIELWIHRKSPSLMSYQTLLVLLLLDSD